MCKFILSIDHHQPSLCPFDACLLCLIQRVPLSERWLRRRRRTTCDRVTFPENPLPAFVNKYANVLRFAAGVHSNALCSSQGARMASS